MPRARKTQAPKSPGLEAGAAYGEVSANIQAQQAIPLPQKASVGGGPSPAISAVPQAPAAQQAPLPVEAARGFTPQITPLMAPGENRPLPTPMIAPTSKQRSSELLQNWAAASGDPIIMAAASQLMGQ
jgi:hypothetical protein